MVSARIISPIVAITVGVVSGVYVFKPLIESFQESTKGTFRPEDDDKSAPVPPLPLTSLLPGKDIKGNKLPTDPSYNLEAVRVDEAGNQVKDGQEASKITVTIR